MTLFIDIPITADAAGLEQDVYDQLAAAFPGWSPAPGNLDVFLTKAFSQIAADLAIVASAVPGAIFAGFGEKIVGVPPLLAASAQATSTWTMTDDAGYTIPAGTLVSILAAGDTPLGFRTANVVTVAPGDTATAAGEVALEAVEPGTAANGLTADPTLIDALTFVESIGLATPTDGGVDAEGDDDYLNRLAAEMTLLAGGVVLPGDAEVLVRRVPEVFRALCLDGYNPDDDTSDNPGIASVAVVADDGSTVSSGAKDDALALLDQGRALNIEFHVIDPTYSTIKAHADVTIVPGFATSDVEAQVIAAIGDWLNPAIWGTPLGAWTSARVAFDVHEWQDRPVIRLNDLIALVDQVPGVAFVTAATLAQGADPLAAADVTMDGPAALPSPGAITATATAP